MSRQDSSHRERNGSEEALRQLLPHLRVHRGPDGRGEYVAWCPFHADGQGKPPHEPNLHVSERGWYCHVCKRGGGLQGLAGELGIKMKEGSSITATYDYRDEQRGVLFQVVRIAPKRFAQRRPDGIGGWIWNLNGTRRVVYRLPELLAEPEAIVYVTEGEKDVDRLRSLGLMATTNPGGAGKWRPEYSELLRDRQVVILPDNDEPGEKHAQQVAASLKGIARSVKVARLPDLSPKGDVSDWLDAGHTVEDLKALPDQSDAAQESGPRWNEASSNEVADDPHRLARAFIQRSGSDASGRLTLRLWRHQWWRWTGTHYQVLDKDELRAMLAGFIKVEFDQWARDSTPDKPPRKVTHQLVTNVMQALSGIVIVSSDVEQPAWLSVTGPGCHYLSMANGLLDLEGLLTGKGDYLILRTPDWFSPYHLPYDFDHRADCSQWLRFLNEILEGDQERIRLLQEWFGYSLTPDTSMQKFLVLEGEGANGKSVVCAILTDLLGRQNVSHVPLERFGDRFQLTMTLGKLANVAAEVGDLDKAAEGVLKAFTAGDRMCFDRKGIPGIEAFPTARLVLATNNRPRFSDRSSGLWRRMLLIPFRVVIPEERQEPHLAVSLRAELPGVFCWAIAGLHRLRRNGRFTDSTLGKAAHAEYRAENNPARLFLIEQCEEDAQGSVACSILYGTYRSWCDANGCRPLGERSFGKEVVRVYPTVTRVKRGTRERREYQYQGLRVSHVS